MGVKTVHIDKNNYIAPAMVSFQKVASKYWIAILILWISVELPPVLGQHPHSVCKGSNTSRTALPLLGSITGYEVSQVCAWSQCELAWMARKGSKYYLVTSIYNGIITDSLGIDASLGSTKILALGNRKFLLLPTRVTDAAINYTVVDAIKRTTKTKLAPIPLENSGLSTYVQHSVQEKAGTEQNGFVWYSWVKIWYAADRVYFLLQRIEKNQVRTSYFLLSFKWNAYTEELGFELSLALYSETYQKQAEEYRILQPTLVNKSENEVIFGLSTDALSTLSLNHKKLQKIPMNPNRILQLLETDKKNIRALQWKLGKTFMPGLDNKAVKSDDLQLIGAECGFFSISDGFTPKGAIKNDKILQSIFLISDLKRNYWFLNTKAEVLSSAYQLGVYEFDVPFLLHCE